MSLGIRSGMKASINREGVDDHRCLPAVGSWLPGTYKILSGSLPGTQAGNWHAMCKLAGLDDPGMQSRHLASSTRSKCSSLQVLGI